MPGGSPLPLSRVRCCIPCGRIRYAPCSAGLLDIARDGVDRAVSVVQTSADGIAGSAEAELGQLGSEIRGVVKAANPIDILGSLFGRR